MTNPNLPDTLKSILDGFEQRIRRLESSPRLGNSSIKDGALRILDADDIERARFGRLDQDYDGDGDTDWGLALFTKEGRANLLVSEDGFVAPSQVTPLAQINGDTFFTSLPDYDSAGRVDFIASSRDWTFDLWANYYPGNTMSFRFLAAIIGDTPDTIYEQTGISTTGVQLTETLNLRELLADDVVGQAVTIRLELRLDSGPGPAALQFLTTPVNWIAP